MHRGGYRMRVTQGDDGVAAAIIEVTASVFNQCSIKR